MTDRSVIVQEHVDLGLIRLVDPDSRFPWEFFMNGEVNCAFQTLNDKDMNDIRIWINKNAGETVYIEHGKWSEYPCTIGFTNPEDAIKFLIKFSDLIKKI